MCRRYLLKIKKIIITSKTVQIVQEKFDETILNN